MKFRSHQLIFILEAVATYPGMKDVWIDGIPTEQHMDFIRHYYLRMLRVQRLIREILEDNTM